jgi:endonuclease IV
MLLMYGQCYHVIRMQLRRPESKQSDFQKDTILGHVSYYINLVQRRNRQDRTQNFRKQ